MAFEVVSHSSVNGSHAAQDPNVPEPKKKNEIGGAELRRKGAELKHERCQQQVARGACKWSLLRKIPPVPATSSHS